MAWSLHFSTNDVSCRQALTGRLALFSYSHQLFSLDTETARAKLEKSSEGILSWLKISGRRTNKCRILFENRKAKAKSDLIPSDSQLQLYDFCDILVQDLTNDPSAAAKDHRPFRAPLKSRQILLSTSQFSVDGPSHTRNIRENLSSPTF